VDGLPVEVEVDISYGLPAFSTVGLPEGAVRESRERVKAAIKNCGYDFPNRRITVNLAPADVKKEGTGYDLPMALGILVASEILKSEKLEKYGIIGELSPSGTQKAFCPWLLRPVTKEWRVSWCRRRMPMRLPQSLVFR
jgi:magnesium chelatase family protein